MQVSRPPQQDNIEGRPRRVGFELEFSGLPLRRAAEVVADLYGGRLEQRSQCCWLARDTSLGTFRAEIDARLLQWMAEEGHLEKDAESLDLGALLAGAVEAVSEQVVPAELVMPPVAWHEIGRLEALREGLRKEGAAGTRESLLYGFGLHINVEIPDRSAPYLTGLLRAFLLLFEQLYRRLRVDWTRKVLPFIAPFPHDYLALLVDPGYGPDLDELIDDYLHFSPTRNRALDLLPLWASINAEKVSRAAPSQKVKPRPAFHYRLPNSSVDNPQWTLTEEWNRWVEVEELAASRRRLERMAQDWIESEDDFLGRWKETVSQWLPHDLLSE